MTHQHRIQMLEKRCEFFEQKLMEVHPHDAPPILQQMRNVEEEWREKVNKLQGHLTWTLQAQAQKIVKRIRDEAQGIRRFSHHVLHQSVKRHQRRSRKVMSKHNQVFQAIRKEIQACQQQCNAKIFKAHEAVNKLEATSIKLEASAQAIKKEISVDDGRVSQTLHKLSSKVDRLQESLHDLEVATTDVAKHSGLLSLTTQSTLSGTATQLTQMRGMSLERRTISVFARAASDSADAHGTQGRRRSNSVVSRAVIVALAQGRAASEKREKEHSRDRERLRSAREGSRTRRVWEQGDQIIATPRNTPRESRSLGGQGAHRDHEAEAQESSSPGGQESRSLGGQGAHRDDDINPELS